MTSYRTRSQALWMNLSPITAILVPQGAEYRAVCRGLRAAKAPYPPVWPLPIGGAAVQQCLATLPLPKAGGILVMGLCGSLHPALSVGRAVLYNACCRSGQPTSLLDCDPTLTGWIQTQLPEIDASVLACTSDRVICTVQEKVHLAQTTGAAVVDMEGWAILQALSAQGRALAMVRVVSDGCQAAIPDLSAAISPGGEVIAPALAIALLRQPLAGIRLVRGSLRGLQQLQRLSTQLFCSSVSYS